MRCPSRPLALSRPFSLSGDVCFFGRAAYFAEEAAYSNSYRHRAGGAAGESQLFLALVAVGRPEERTFGVPSDAACKATKHPAAGFDSIHADVGGPGKAVMAYKVRGGGGGQPYVHAPPTLGREAGRPPKALAWRTR